MHKFKEMISYGTGFKVLHNETSNAKLNSSTLSKLFPILARN
jgi:hypothetical protein